MHRKARFHLPLLSATLLLGLALGYVSHRAVHADEGASSLLPYAQLDTFARVLSHIERSYVDEVSADDLIYGAIKGMVDQLDPHSGFLTPEEYQAMRNETRGEYVGVGMELGTRNGEITVIAPVEGGPAFEAGVEAGDVVLEVDGDRVVDDTLQDVVRRLRGELGIPVDLLVRRDQDDTLSQELSFTIVRDVIHIQAVRSELLAPGYGLIHVSTFQLGVSNDVVAAIDSLTVDNGGELQGLVLDLRNNPGGLLSEGIAVSDVFLDEGIVVTTEGRSTEENTTHSSRDSSTRYRGPLVVLVNGGTASASEIVAGALQDRERATLVGITTFGKATVQSIIDFDDGSGLKLTVARYFSPDHRAIHGAGIEPDQWVPAGTIGPSSEEAPLPEGFEPIIDAQVRAALDHLLGME